MTKVERAIGVENLYAPENGQLVNHLIQAIKAKELYKRDDEYVIMDGEVKIVDEFTGRIMEGRRWSEGLHQAVEAKEGVRIQEENVTVATVTIQNYFRMYEKLAGMTGTALTEANEFHEIYGLEVVPIPTHRPMVRDDQNDQIYRTKEEKFAAVVDDIVERHATGQPVLVGTISVEVSEHLSHLLERRGIPHEVLNAKNHEREALIIQNAGERGAVTIATNMAGRGVDIKLADGVSPTSAASTCSAPSGTSRAASTTSSAAAPAARATPASRASTSRLRTRSSGSSPASASTRSSTRASGRPTVSRSRPRCSRTRSRAPRRRSRSSTS